MEEVVNIALNGAADTKQEGNARGRVACTLKSLDGVATLLEPSRTLSGWLVVAAVLDINA
jgi:hypothetical protein